MKLISKLSLAISAVVLLSSLLTACHTISGMGQDIQSGGKAISRAAS